VFEAYEAVLRDLQSLRISRRERIAISGGSHRGLLVAAVVTRAPSLLAAAVAQVGLYAMLRYPLFPPAQLWVSEYGDPTTAEGARYLHGYSPYHQVVEGTEYPAMLIQTATDDTRVHWAHSTKLAARMQRAQAGSRPIYFYMEEKQGHGRGTRLADLVARASRTYAFLEQQLSVR
jgi:prolyl oligopeptidase